MALPVFSNGNFEITSLSFSPAVIAVGKSGPFGAGQSTSFSVTLKNVSGVRISKCYVRAQFTAPIMDEDETSYSNAFESVLYGNSTSDRAPISWPDGGEYTFNGSLDFYNPLIMDSIDMRRYVLRDVRMSMNIVTDEGLKGGGNFDNTAWPPPELTDGGYLAVLSRRDNPALYFEAERAPTDESVTLSASLWLSGDADAAVMSAHGYTAALYKGLESSGIADEEIPLNCTVEELLAGINDSMSVITGEFPNTAGWLLKLVVTNGYETASAAVSISRAFANMHLSGKTTGGVAFGGFSTSEEGNPKAEFHYRIYPYAGIEGLGITYPKPNETWADSTTGEEQFTGDYWIDGKPIYRRTAEGYMGTTYDTNFSSIGPVESVVKMYGYATFSGRTWRIPVNTYVSSEMYWACWVEDATGTVRTRVKPAGANIWVVIEYTKPD